MRTASLKYRLQLPGFVLTDAVIASLKEYDECSAQMLENIADRIEGKTPREEAISSDSSALLEHTLESCRVDGARLLLSEHGEALAPLLRQIDLLTRRVASQVAVELDAPATP